MTVTDETGTSHRFASVYHRDLRGRVLRLAFLPMASDNTQTDAMQNRLFAELAANPGSSSGAFVLKQLVFRIDPERHLDFRGDGEIVISEESVTWRPGGSGTALHYTFLIDHLRDARSYDARITKTWALFRGDDLVPPARSTATARDSRPRPRSA